MEERLPDGGHVIWSSQSCSLPESAGFSTTHNPNISGASQTFDLALNRQLAAVQTIPSLTRVQYTDDPTCLRLQFAIPQYSVSASGAMATTIQSSSMPTLALPNYDRTVSLDDVSHPHDALPCTNASAFSDAVDGTVGLPSSLRDCHHGLHPVENTILLTAPGHDGAVTHLQAQGQSFPLAQPLILPNHTNHLLHGVSTIKESDLVAYTTLFGGGQHFSMGSTTSSVDVPAVSSHTLFMRADKPQAVPEAHTTSLTSSSVFHNNQPQPHSDATSTSVTIQILPTATPTPNTSVEPVASDVPSVPVTVVSVVNQLRKSDRIATRSTEILPKKRKYVPKVYSIKEIWCEECKTSYEEECLEHRLTIISDKMVLSRAWASLPAMLEIFRFGQTTDLGVFAKRPLAKNTQFGPLTGELVTSRNDVTSKIIIMLEKDDEAGNGGGYFNLVDENQCNWMMFVRPADSYSEQNLVMYQHGSDIFYTVCRNIDSKQELKVWYAQHYAERIGINVHQMNDQDRQEQEQDECKWQCFECNERFRTSAQLEKHMSQHEEGTALAESDSDHNDQTKTHHTPFVKRKRGRPSKILKELADGKFLSWKKRTTNLYLNKTLKKYQRRHDSEAIRRSIKSLYRRRGRGMFNTWVCLHCGLTFNNSSLLNLHTLTHAAEDVGRSDLTHQRDLTTQAKLGDLGFTDTGDNIDVNNLYGSLACPVCCKEFAEKVDLIEHASEHAMPLSTEKPNMCPICYKDFTNSERLQRHMLCHGDARDKPFPCTQCDKRFMTNSALSCHRRTHSSTSYYECPICGNGFSRGMMLKDHVQIHQVNGFYECLRCPRKFPSYKQLRKHLNNNHGNQVHTCPQCHKMFCMLDKLKIHMLKHSSVREFMCEMCGKQFKRRDKLNEHTKRMHSKEKEEKVKLDQQVSLARRRFVPKVSPNEYQRFIYKCHSCLLGFKRRGMLINHLVKRHPDLPLDTVPELNMPILKEQKDFYCQYCDKIYKSSSKRKSHILKKHPGASLPLGRRSAVNLPEIPGLPNATFSQTVGSVTTLPQLCEFCHKQYASRAKLLQHQRSKHPTEYSYLQMSRRLAKQTAAKPQDNNIEGVGGEVVAQMHTDQGETVHVMINAAPTTHTDLSDTDLLTQAMSELSHTFGQAGAVRILNSQNLASLPSVTPDTTTIQFAAPIMPSYQRMQNLANVPIGELKQVDAEVEEINESAESDISSHNAFTNIPVVIAPNSFVQKNNWQNYVYQS